MGVITELYSNSLNTISSFATSGWQATYTAAGSFFTVSATIGMMMIGIGLYFGRFANVMAAVWKVLGLCLIIAVWSNWAAFNLQAKRTVIDDTDSFAVVLLSGAGSNPYASPIVPECVGQVTSTSAVGALETTLCNASQAGSKLWESADYLDLAAGVLFLLMLLGAVIFVAITIGLLLIAKAAAALMLAVGPIFICLAFFEYTRRWFFAWVNQLCNYIVLQLLVYASLYLFNASISRIAVSINASGDYPTSYQILPFVVACVTGVFLMLQTPRFAAALTASGELMTTGFLNVGKAAIKKAGSVVSGASKQSTYKSAFDDAKNKYNAVTEGAKSIGGGAKAGGRRAQAAYYSASSAVGKGASGVGRQARALAFSAGMSRGKIK